MVKKSLFSLVMIFIFLFSFPLHVNALSNTSATTIQTIAESKLSSFGEYTVAYSQELYNIHLQLEAVCYNFNPYGYVIVNVNDYSVPEFSPSSNAPYNVLFENSDHILIYNGPGNYFYYTEHDQLISVDSGSVISINDIDYIYCSETVSTSEYLKTNAISRGSTIPLRLIMFLKLGIHLIIV